MTTPTEKRVRSPRRKKVVRLVPVPSRARKSLVAFCAELLAQAKRGELRDLAIVRSTHGSPVLRCTWLGTSEDLVHLGMANILVTAITAGVAG